MDVVFNFLGYEASALFSRQFAISQFPFTAENFPTYLQGHRFDAETVRLLGIAFDGNCHGNRRPDQSLIGAFISLTGRCIASATPGRFHAVIQRGSLQNKKRPRLARVSGGIQG